MFVGETNKVSVAFADPVFLRLIFEVSKEFRIFRFLHHRFILSSERKVLVTGPTS